MIKSDNTVSMGLTSISFDSGLKVTNIGLAPNLTSNLSKAHETRESIAAK